VPVMDGLAFDAGRPVHLPVPDPRAYAAFRLCRLRDPDRSAQDLDRDRVLARAAAHAAVAMGLEPGGPAPAGVPANLRAAVTRLAAAT
jgi:hypothetical protein